MTQSQSQDVAKRPGASPRRPDHPPRPPLLGPVAPAKRSVTRAILLGVLVAAWLPVSHCAQPTAVASAEESEAIGAWVRSFHRAWSGKDVAALRASFAPDAVIDLGPESYVSTGRLEFSDLGRPHTAGLRTGIRALVVGAPAIGVESYRTAEIVFGGVPATQLAWQFEGDAGPMGLPALRGTDELVVRDGQVLHYARHTDPASEARRSQALMALIDMNGTRTAGWVGTAKEAERAPHNPAPDGQDTSTIAAARAVILGLGALAAAAARRRWRVTSTGSEAPAGRLNATR